MSNISQINSTALSQQAGRLSVETPISNRTADDVRGRGGARTSDRVEFSQMAQYLSKLQSEPTERTDLINRVRSEIQSGTYLTEDKLSATADELLDDITFSL